MVGDDEFKIIRIRMINENSFVMVSHSKVAALIHRLRFLIDRSFVTRSFVYGNVEFSRTA